ncbi:hypothetical protein ACQFX9_29560 [Aliinostoc sp. HNIBRCY26]|uniref:hypothetical protein n=1 Tax=Aliinostoc sp. HNIBRCY26 TaxID=3418997 RepID=UPI003D003026
MSSKKLINRFTQLSSDSPWLIIIIFSVLGLVGIINHAMWRDELNPWLIVRDSTSFGELINNIRYEGHPVLWYFSLVVIRMIADTPVIMQIFHLSITILAVILFWLYSPFNYQQKLIFTFGYFPFYEYLLISRNYAFSLLFVFGFCAVFPSRKKTYLYLAILLGLLANSSAYALLVALSLSLTLLVEFCFDREHRQQYIHQSQRYDLFLSISIIIFAFILSILTITPPSDSYLHGGLDNGWLLQLDFQHFLRSISRLFGTYFLIVPHKRWLDLIVCSLIVIFICVLTVIRLSKKPFSVFLFITANLILLTFTYLRFAGHTRHFGHFYLVLIAALWLGRYYHESDFIINKFRITERLFMWGHKWQNIALMLILYAQLLGGIYGFARDIIIPFSASRETANYIKREKLNDEFIVASRDANMAVLSGYLNRKFYYPELQDLGSYTLFKSGRKPVEKGEILEQINGLLKNKNNKNRILLILNKKLTLKHENLQIVPIESFEKSWVDSERYYLYWVSKINN